MNLINRRITLALILSGAALVTDAVSAQGKIVDGMEVFYGVVPAEIISKRADVHDPKMHGGKRRSAGSHHVIVSISDSKTGQHISDATVIATVTPLGLAPQEKRLDPMLINESTTYGNFFDFPPGSDPFRISLKITRPNVPAHSGATLEFEHRRPSAR